MLYSSFGDTVTPFRMVSSGPPIYPCVKREPMLTAMRLKLQRTMMPNLYHTPANLSQVFELTNLKRDRTKLPPALYYNPCSVQRKATFAFVARNNRFCSPLHRNSAVGDLLTIIWLCLPSISPNLEQIVQYYFYINFEWFNWCDFKMNCDYSPILTMGEFVNWLHYVLWCCKCFL